MSADVSIVQAMKGFSNSFTSVRFENGFDSVDHLKSGILSYYSDQFTAEYLNQTGHDSSAKVKSIVDSLDADSIALQHLYISANKNPLGSKHKLMAANDASRYSRIHEKYHPSIKKFVDEFGFDDIFLVDSKSGNIVYSVFKELDYATSLIDGPYADTNFARVFQEAKAAKDPDFVKLVDFEAYFPSYKRPASFMASPIFSGGEKIGVLIFKMPIDTINSVMTSHNHWKQVGLGESGETYIVGDDYKIRNQSRFFIEDPEGYLGMMKDLGVDTEILDLIKHENSTILLQEVKTPGTEAALNGKTNTEIFSDYRGLAVVSSYKPLAIDDMHWAIMSEINEEEAFRPLQKLIWSILLWLAIGVAIISVISWRVARSIAKPLQFHYPLQWQ